MWASRASIAEALKAGWRKPMPVVAWLNGKPRGGWRINLMPMGDGRFYLYLRGDARAEAGVGVGDHVNVALKFDEAYRAGPVNALPAAFESALDSTPKARRNWDALTPSLRKEILRYFAGLKSDDARTRNIAKALRVLSGRSERFLARAWKSGAPTAGH